MSKRKRVLCVDDDKDTREMLELLLRSSGLDAFSASDQDEAVRLMEKEKIDLYIFDSLPSGQPNVSLCEYVRARSPEAPIIIYSGRAREVDREAGFRAGATDYVTKPHLDPLLAAVLRHISNINRPVTAEQTGASQTREVAARHYLEAERFSPANPPASKTLL